MQFYASRWKIQPRQITRDWGNVAVSWRLCLRIEGLKRNWGVYKWRLKMFNMRLKLIYVMQTLKKNQTNYEKLRWLFLKTVQLNSMCYSEGWSFSGNLFFFFSLINALLHNFTHLVSEKTAPQLITFIGLCCLSFQLSEHPHALIQITSSSEMSPTTFTSSFFFFHNCC